MALSKRDLQAQLRQGRKAVAYVDADPLEGEIGVRALTKGEEDHVNELALGGQTIRANAEELERARQAAAGEDASPEDIASGEVAEEFTIDLSGSARGQAAAAHQTVAYGMSVNGDTWSPKEAASLPRETFNRVLEKVHELAGTDGLLEEARTFRADGPGSDDGVPASDGDAAGGDAG